MTTISADRLFERLLVGASGFVLLGAAAVLTTASAIVRPASSRAVR